MKNKFLKQASLAVLLSACLSAQNVQASRAAFQEEKQEEKDKEGGKDADVPEKGNNYPNLKINGTNKSAVISVTPNTLQTDQPITLTVSRGFTVTPSTIPANAKNTKVTVTLNSYKAHTSGLLVLRSGDIRSYVNLYGTGSALPARDLSRSPVFKGGTASEFAKSGKDFSPSEKGYTVEYKVNSKADGSEFMPYAVDSKGIGFTGFASDKGMGLYSSTSKKEFTNPLTSVPGGKGTFYNNDGRSHIYRYAVTPDNRIFIYRDGIAIDTVRAADYGTQADFASETGDPKENLLKNPDFEGDFDAPSKMAKAIEGWDILIGDIYNSEQYIDQEEIDNKLDFNNHILTMKRYKWAAGWSAAEISQVIDVAPNETYTLSALMKGGVEPKDGKLFGKVKIVDEGNRELSSSAEITSEEWETYSLDFTTSASCKQIRVIFYLERDKWGSNVTPLKIDNVKLTGKSRKYVPKIGFKNKQASVDYFTYDLTGAYAPENVPAINVTLEK
jgi:carbohydrate binding protein with CBM4/9 domain